MSEQLKKNLKVSNSIMMLDFPMYLSLGILYCMDSIYGIPAKPEYAKSEPLFLKQIGIVCIVFSVGILVMIIVGRLVEKDISRKYVSSAALAQAEAGAQNSLRQIKAFNVWCIIPFTFFAVLFTLYFHLFPMQKICDISIIVLLWLNVALNIYETYLINENIKESKKSSSGDNK